MQPIETVSFGSRVTGKLANNLSLGAILLASSAFLAFYSYVYLS